MSGTSSSTVYIGNLDDRVSERVLYDILIQAGRVVDLHIPKERETEKRKGYAFAQYESEEIANYAVKLFSGLVSLHSRTLKFGISGQDKVSNNGPSSGNPASHRPRSQAVQSNRPSSQLGRYNQDPLPTGDGNGYEYSRRIFGSTMDGINRSRQPRRFDSGDPVSYPPY